MYQNGKCAKDDENHILTTKTCYYNIIKQNDHNKY